jgi:hypothetical protein
VCVCVLCVFCVCFVRVLCVFCLCVLSVCVCVCVCVRVCVSPAFDSHTQKDASLTLKPHKLVLEEEEAPSGGEGVRFRCIQRN